MKSEIHTTSSAEETEALGRAFSERLAPGDRVALIGELGAGKTCFVRGVASGLDSGGCVKSPSFTMVNVYTGGRLELYHIDLYRLSSEDEIFETGIEEYVYGSGVSVIEWADRSEALTAACNTIIRFTHKGAEKREIEIKWPAGEQGLEDRGFKT